MANFSVMDKLRSFLGINREPPRNDFRNPIWISDDEDDGDELYARGNSDTVFIDPIEKEHDLFFKQMNDMFKSFRSMIGDMKLFDDDFGSEFMLPITDHPSEESTNPNDIRSYYLKPGYHNHNRINENEPPKDLDLDGKVSSHEISSLLKRKEDHDQIQPTQPHDPFNGKLVPSRSFCKTIITTSIRKPDGTVETRKIIKDGNEVIEQVTTTQPDQPDTQGPYSSNMDPVGPMGQIGPMGDSGMFYNNFMSEFSSLFRNYF